LWNIICIKIFNSNDMDVKKNKPQQKPGKEISVKEKKKITKYWIGGYLIIAAICLAFYLLIQFGVFNFFGEKEEVLKRISLTIFFGFLVLIFGKIAELFIRRRSHDKGENYNLIRAIRLVTVVLIGIVIISFLYKNWYSAALSLGLISLILGFALQVPISSFIAWLYIIFRNPYRVGDRIQISPFKGDVVEIGYLDTTLWEFGGDYLTTDMPSGRLIRFPNSLILQSAVFNYSWPKFPYIWNEIPFQVAYGSDLGFVEQTLKEVTRAELDPDMANHINHLKDLIKDTPVDELQIKEFPSVSFRINANTWVEALVTYLVEPKKASASKTRIIKNVLQALNKEPAKTMFPKGDSR